MTENPKPSLLSTLAASSKKSGVISKPAEAPAAKPSLLSPGKSFLNPAKAAPAAPTEQPKSTASSLLTQAKAASDRKTEIDRKAEVVFKEMPIDFQQLLDDFDSMMADSTGVDLLTIDTSRAYVKRIMTDLKSNPEYDGMIMARDVHNIIKLIRALRESAVETIGTKKVKTEKATVNKAAKKGRFGDVGSLTLDFKGAPDSLEDISDLDFPS